MSSDRAAHWERVYTDKAANEVSWFEESPATSLALIEECGAGQGDAVIDIGGGASRLADTLLAKGFADITVLDVAEAALAQLKLRLGPDASHVTWITADVTVWQPPRTYSVWHDRAVFHFLASAADRGLYRQCLLKALRPGGHAIIGTFALDGPERCSGLPVVRYDADMLARELGPSFEFVSTRRHGHTTPAGKIQEFQFGVFRRLP